MKTNILFFLFILFSVHSKAQIKDAAHTENKTENIHGLVKWMTIEEAVVAWQKTPKKIIIDIYTDWCGWCKVMDKKTYNCPSLVKYLEENFYMVKFDAEQKDSLQLGETWYRFIPQGGRGYHELAAALTNGKLSYPTTVFLDSNFSMIQPVAGYLRATEMEGIVRYLNHDYKGEMTYEEFLKTFVPHSDAVELSN